MPIYGYKDEDGNDVDLSKILTIIIPVTLEGENGTEKSFWFHRQYQFDSIEDHDTYYFKGELTDTLRQLPCYKVVTDDDTFYVPMSVAVVEMKLRTRDQQDFEKWKEKKADQPRDMLGAFKKLTGVDIKQTHDIRQDGIRVYEEALRNRTKKTKIPFRREQDEDYEQTY